MVLHNTSTLHQWNSFQFCLSTKTYSWSFLYFFFYPQGLECMNEKPLVEGRTKGIMIISPFFFEACSVNSPKAFTSRVLHKESFRVLMSYFRFMANLCRFYAFSFSIKEERTPKAKYFHCQINNEKEKYFYDRRKTMYIHSGCWIRWHLRGVTWNERHFNVVKRQSISRFQYTNIATLIHSLQCRSGKVWGVWVVKKKKVRDICVSCLRHK